MAKIKDWFRNLSIVPTFILVTIVSVFMAMICIEIEKTLLINEQRKIAFQYMDVIEGYNGTKVWNENVIINFSKKDSQIVQVCEFFIWVLSPVTYLIFLFTAGYFFYRKKIKYPLYILMTSADKIANRNLDFSIEYDRTDEMGKLCMAFEKMRAALENNHREIWRQMDERRRLNAAFSHDLRIPLTVLEGNLDILQMYTPDGKLKDNEIAEIYMAMLEQTKRLKKYVATMSELQRLEDISVVLRNIDVVDFIKMLEDSAVIICSGIQLIVKNEIHIKTLKIDPEIVMQVLENILSNGIRYTKECITVTCKVEKEAFFVCVKDDGIGFEEKALNSATSPFYTTEKKAHNQHLGVGLNICKILCRRHNGNIILENDINGGAIVTVSFKMDE